MKEVFLDGASNTPLDPKVFKAMKPFLSPKFMGNASSSHDFGIRASMAIETARDQVAEATGAKREDIYFTSGATEGNNWVINSIAEQQRFSGMKRPRIICSATEHSSVLNSCKNLIKYGFDVIIINPLSTGNITTPLIRKYLDKETALVCVMAVNNEIGTINEIDGITKVARHYGAKTLIDCTQALSYGGKAVEICKNYPYRNFFTFSAHKIYGPTGVGCLIAQNADITPFLRGGGQERGKRAGTSNTAGIVGLGAAISKIHQENYEEHYLDLFRYFTKQLHSVGQLNITPGQLNILNINFKKIKHITNLAAVLATYGVAVSAGSACDAEHDDLQGFNPSHVLTAMGIPEEIIRRTIRVSFTKYTTYKDIDYFFKAINDVIKEDTRND